MINVRMVQFSHSGPTLCDPMDWSRPGFPLHHLLPELTHIHVHWVDDAIQPSHPLLSPSSAFNLSQHQGLFSNESVLHIRWPKYWSFSFSISISNEYSKLISFRIDWFHLLVVQWTLIFSSTTVQKHLFFGAQSSLWSNSHIHTWLLKKTTALTMWTFVSKVMSLLLNMQSRFPLLFFQGASIF